LFTLKIPKITYLSLGGFQVLGRFISFLAAMDWFNKVSIVFSRCFGYKKKKRVENGILSEKNKGSCFSGHHNG
jgi:hypothetical protein